ncbi:hypothetical protein [Natronoglycomyces albus]|uniref:Uncharacterized protein n=1 Tax=Natronoglycomyces albus TaxID=2811108 RepID=A0A895XGK9_9ACTN|nr:hypothetical protein [Natronoglycomyces albus]QSB04017.1 hypothetical protein JQS30_09290 [Natronoglycomyces albus]
MTHPWPRSGSAHSQPPENDGSPPQPGAGPQTDTGLPHREATKPFVSRLAKVCLIAICVFSALSIAGHNWAAADEETAQYTALGIPYFLFISIITLPVIALAIFLIRVIDVPISALAAGGISVATILAMLSTLSFTALFIATSGSSSAPLLDSGRPWPFYVGTVSQFAALPFLYGAIIGFAHPSGRAWILRSEGAGVTSPAPGRESATSPRPEGRTHKNY